jgi:hypothetical protein
MPGEWLLQFALLLFIADIGIRRVQIERAEWLKATASLRRALFFWKPPTQAPTQEESLAALLARRAAVRQSTTAAGETRADLFQPTAPGDTPLPTEFGGTVATSATEAQTEIPSSTRRTAVRVPRKCQPAPRSQAPRPGSPQPLSPAPRVPGVARKPA